MILAAITSPVLPCTIWLQWFHICFMKVHKWWIRREAQYSGLSCCPVDFVSLLYSRMVLVHLLLTLPRVNLYQPISWYCSAYAVAKSISGPTREPAVGARDLPWPVSKWSPSENPWSIVFSTGLGVDNLVKFVSSSFRRRSLHSVVEGKGHFKTCSKVSSNYWQPGHLLEVP